MYTDREEFEGWMERIMERFDRTEKLLERVLKKNNTLDGEEVTLTPTEYDILRLLLENPGKVFSSADIYRRVWKDEPFSAEGTVPVHIRHLREKLEIDPANPRYLKVVWGKGYKLEEMKK